MLNFTDSSMTEKAITRGEMVFAQVAPESVSGNQVAIFREVVEFIRSRRSYILSVWNPTKVGWSTKWFRRGL
jgi:hypothetical protein